LKKYRILVKGIVKNEDKYLVVRKWYDDRIVEPYQWEFVDGVLEFGEIPDQSVIRHVLEQTGLSSTIDKILYTWTFQTGEVFNIGISYLCLTPLDSVILSEDLVEYQWIKREDFASYISRKVLADIERVEL
jgi:nucleoside triphosphatase